MGRSLSPQARKVLRALLNAPGHTGYGYGISQSTGLKSGTLYPILMRLAELNLVDASWESVQTGKPPRHVYKLTARGIKLAIDLRAAHGTAKLRAALAAGRG
jgi:DNA-binding PadR family transcriptional regulator